MKIRRLYINGFGKFNNEVFTLSDNNQLIFGLNESGKSTMYQFIRMILFGFPKKRDKVRDYTPLEGASYGGHIIIDHPKYGEVYIERFKEKNKGQAFVRLSDGQTGEEALLSQVIAPLTLEIFDQIFSFQHEQLTDLDDLNESKLQRLLLSVGLTGSERLNALSDQFTKQRQQLFKPSGRIPILNQKLKEFNRLEESIHIVEEQEQLYREKVQRKDQLNMLLLDNRNEQDRLLSLEKTLSNQQRFFPMYVEYQGLKKAQVSGEKISESTVRSVSDALQDYRYLVRKEKDLLDNQMDLSNDVSPATQFYLDNQEVFDSILEDQLSVESVTEKREILTAQLDIYEQSKADLFSKYQLSRALVDVEVTEMEEQQLKSLAEREEELIRQKVILSNERGRLNIQKKNMDRVLSASEEQMAAESNPYAINLNPAPMATDTPPPLRKDPFAIKMFSLLSLSVGIMMLLLGFTLDSTILFIVAGFFAVVGLFGLYKGFKMPKQSTDSVTPDKQLYVEQLTLSDGLMAQLNQLEQDELHYTENQELVEREKAHWASKYGFSTSETVAVWLTKLPLFNQLKDIQNNEKSITDDLNKIDDTLRSYNEMLLFANQWIPMSENVRNNFKAVKEFVSIQKDSLLNLHDSSSSITQSEIQMIRTQKEDIQRLVNQLTGAHESTPIEKAQYWVQQQETFQVGDGRLMELEVQLKDYFDFNKHYELLQINQELMKLNESLETCLEQERAFQTERQTIEYAMKQMEKNGSLDDLYQKREIELARIEELTKDWLTIRFAEEITQDVFKFLSEQQLPALLSTVTNYFNLLTEGKYDQVLIKHGQLLVKDYKRRIFPIIQLSTGAKDQLYVAFRMAYFQLHTEDYNVPIIIDDGWLHFDEQRKQTLFKLLTVFGEKNQIICFTSDVSMKQYYEQHSHSIIDLEQER